MAGTMAKGILPNSQAIPVTYRIAKDTIQATAIPKGGNIRPATRAMAMPQKKKRQMVAIIKNTYFGSPHA